MSDPGLTQRSGIETDKKTYHFIQNVSNGEVWQKKLLAYTYNMGLKISPLFKQFWYLYVKQQKHVYQLYYTTTKLSTCANQSFIVTFVSVCFMLFITSIPREVLKYCRGPPHSFDIFM